MQKKLFYTMLLGCLLTTGYLSSQEDVASREEMLVEQQHINFETFFFQALQEKAIGNYDKAIYALEACQDIDDENIAVLFEFSKNYYFLNKYTEAEYYGMLALKLDPKNLYLLRHLKEINLKQNDYKGAISFQKLIIEQVPEEEPEIIFILIRAGDIENAKLVLKTLDDNGKLPESFRVLKESLLQTVKPTERTTVIQAEEMPKTRLDQLKETYSVKNDYKSLKDVLEREIRTKKYLLLKTDSEEAMSLYASQPYVYLANAIALNSLRKYKEAINILNDGLEFIVDDPDMESKFMEQLSLSYKGLGENKKATEYYNKMLELKKEK